MSFHTNSTTRRSFLRMGGSMMALPFLETFAAPKAAAATPAKRMIFLGGGFGFTKDTFYPKKAGLFAEIGMTEGLSPLARHQDDITMVSNMTNLGATDPHGGSVSYLTGANVAGTPGKRFHNSVSCDQVIARKIGEDTRFPCLVLSAKEADGGQTPDTVPASPSHGMNQATPSRASSGLSISIMLCLPHLVIPARNSTLGSKRNRVSSIWSASTAAE